MTFLESAYKNTYRIMSGKKFCHEKINKYHPILAVTIPITVPLASETQDIWPLIGLAGC